MTLPKLELTTSTRIELIEQLAGRGGVPVAKIVTFRGVELDQLTMLQSQTCIYWLLSNAIPDLQSLEGALAGLDKAEPSHWTKDGLPDLRYLTERLGRRVKRGEVKKTGVTRATAA